MLFWGQIFSFSASARGRVKGESGREIESAVHPEVKGTNRARLCGFVRGGLRRRDFDLLDDEAKCKCHASEELR